jgi:SH3-like domain-containing protein
MKMKVNSKPYPELNIRKSAAKKSPVVGTLKDEDVVEVETCRSGMGKLADGKGWVNLDFMLKVEEPHPEPEEDVVE